MELARRLRDISLEDAKEAYEELKEQPCKKPGLNRIGTKTLDYFFLGHRLKTKTRSHMSFVDAMKDPAIVKRLSELVERYKKKSLSSFSDPDELLKQQYSVFQLYYGTINQFRPTVARWIYCTLKPVRGILDFSAGWGGRCLAAMSMNIPYVGIDANAKLEPAYQQMIRTINPDANVKLLFQPSETVDFSKFTYDLVMTSPPYFMIEEYEKMPAYKSKEGFLQKFFIPVVEQSWKYLLPGGHMALNMPHEMYMAVRHILPLLHKRMLLPLHNRHPTNAVMKQTIGSEKERHEIIYVWKKGTTGRTTRKKKRVV
jgi:hypothetical protein